MSDLLRNNIEKHIRFSDEEFEVFKSLTISKEIKKNEFLVQSGDHIKYLAFVASGVLHSYSVDDKGEKHVVQIALENHWISDPYGFLTQDKAIYNVSAIEKSQLILISKDNFEKVCTQIPQFERFFRILIQGAYIQSLQRISGIYGKSAEERYVQLMESSPDMMQKVPQHYIASFLGIKPQSLSRIRKNLMER